MKKNLLKIGLTLALIFHCAFLWAAPDLFGNYTHYLSYEKKTFTTGLKLTLSMAEGRFSIDNHGNYNYGISLFSENYFKHFPMKCNVGNLSIGGLVSKLNNPMISTTTSGYESCYSAPSVITSSLPSYSYFSKPFSTFLEAGWENEEKLVQEVTINSAYTPKTKDLSFSSKLKLCFTDDFGITNCFGLSFFPMKENDCNYWYFSTPYYRESGSFCFADQFELQLFNFFSTFSIFSYKSPFPEKNNKGILKNIYKTENKLETNHFTIGISALFNNNPHIISRENKLLQPCTQIKSNIQYNTDFGKNGDYSIKAGITAFENINAYKNKENDFKLGCSTTINFPLTSVTAEGNFSYKIPEINRSMILQFISANIENSWDFEYISPTIGISSQYYLSQENCDIKKYKFNVGFSFLHGLITNDNSLSFSLKDNEIYDKNIRTGINVNFSCKKFIISAKIAGEFRI